MVVRCFAVRMGIALGSAALRNSERFACSRGVLSKSGSLHLVWPLPKGRAVRVWVSFHYFAERWPGLSG